MIDRHDMSLEVLLGPMGSGKTSACLQRLRDSGGRARLLVPSEADAAYHRASTLDEKTIRPIGEFIKELAGAHNRASTLVRPGMRRLVLADLIEREIPADGYFAAVKDAPGFAGAVGDCIREMMLSGITPGALLEASEAVAGDDPTFRSKSIEIARTFAAYSSFLSNHNLLDEDDLPALAAARIRSGRTRVNNLDIVLLDGFHRLSRTWRDLLLALAEKEVRVLITLPFEESRLLLFATSSCTLRALKRDFSVVETHMTAAGRSNGPSTLRDLGRQLFAPPVDKIHIPDLESRRIEILDAPSHYAEAEMVARRIRIEHDTNGTPWNRCAIILRTPQEYECIVTAVFERLGVPLRIKSPRRLLDDPALKPLVHFARVCLAGWQKDDVIAFLKSGFVGIDKLSVENLRRIARLRRIREGRENWIEDSEAIAPALRAILERMAGWDELLMSHAQPAGRFAQMLEMILHESGVRERSNDAGDANHEKALNAAPESMN